MKAILLSLVVLSLTACGTDPAPTGSDAGASGAPQQQPVTGNASNAANGNGPGSDDVKGGQGPSSCVDLNGTYARARNAAQYQQSAEGLGSSHVLLQLQQDGCQNIVVVSQPYVNGNPQSTSTRVINADGACRSEGSASTCVAHFFQGDQLVSETRSLNGNNSDAIVAREYVSRDADGGLVVREVTVESGEEHESSRKVYARVQSR
jgi:hypothetical protein